MKKLKIFGYSLLLVIFTVAVVYAAAPAGLVMRPDGGGGLVAVQGFAPNGRLSQNLTVTRTVVNLTGKTAWSVYVPANASFRLQSTATRAGLTRTLPSGGFIRYVNPATPFVSFSSCTNGELDIQ